jgi:hypothetical protein
MLSRSRAGRLRFVRWLTQFGTTGAAGQKARAVLAKAARTFHDEITALQEMT